MSKIRKAETEGNIESSGEVIQKVITDLICRKDGTVKGMPTGFNTLDECLSGLNLGNLIVIAGHPGMGATSLALNICEHLSIDMEIPVLYFSLQDSSQILFKRIMFGRSRIDLIKARHCDLTDKEMELLKKTGRLISEKHFFIDDTPRLSLSEIKERAKKVKKSENIKCVIIDLLQAMRLQERIDLNEDDIALISKELKLLALELNVPVILLVELCFDLIRKDQEPVEPRIADLGSAISVERYADVLMMINRESYFCYEEAYCRDAEIIISKNANGSKGVVCLKFWHELARFSAPGQELIGQT